MVRQAEEIGATKDVKNSLRNIEEKYESVVASSESEPDGELLGTMLLPTPFNSSSFILSSTLLTPHHLISFRTYPSANNWPCRDAG